MNSLTKQLAKEFLEHFKPLQLNLHSKYLPITRLKRLWLFITFRSRPINPKWQEMVDRINTGDDIIRFRRPTDYDKPITGDAKCTVRGASYSRFIPWEEFNSTSKKESEVTKR